MANPFSDTLVERLAQARSVAVLTGAGISAESGIRTFRDPDGHWEQYRPEDLANPHAFRRNPHLVQRWYATRIGRASDAAPNPGHYALVELAKLVPEFTLVTQNVDNLHQRAGSTGVIELHGNITRQYCIDCGTTAPPYDLAALNAGTIATCHVCGGLVRPGVVWFTEALPDGALETGMEAARACDVFLSIGTSAVVIPAAWIPLEATRAYTAEVNIARSAIADELDEVVLGPSGVVLPALIAAVKTRLGVD